MREHWSLDPTVIFLNHGSFGACPKKVQAEQRRLQAQMEAEPVRFMLHERPQLLEAARRRVSSFVGAEPSDIAFVSNATEGVNAVVRSLDFQPGDEILTTNQLYAACTNVLRYVADRSAARVVCASIPFPINDEQDVINAVLARVTARTRLAVLDHITSATGLILPIKELVAELRKRGVDTLVDGAHAPGMVELSLRDLEPAYYAANFHKWLCAPKGSGMLWVHPDRQKHIHPTVTSHGYSAAPPARFLAEFDWVGTSDPSPWLCLPSTLDHLSELGSGWPALRKRNRALVLQGRELLCQALEVELPAPERMIGSIAAVPLPPGHTANAPFDRLQFDLMAQHRIETLVSLWPQPPERVLRISAQLYNSPSEYQQLAEVLPGMLGAPI